MSGRNNSGRVALFTTCVVDAMRPQTGFAAVRLLEAAGFGVDAPAGQTCCGQPAHNAGDAETAKALARRMIALFRDYDYVVAPSGSCAGMVRRHYPELFAPQEPECEAARALAEKTFELTQFLFAHGGRPLLRRWTGGPVAWHDSCSCLRGLGVRDEPRALLRRIPGLEIVEMDDAESCCGFGGLFSVKLPEVSGHMARRKVENIVATGAETLIGPDMGCLLNIAGMMRRMGVRMKVYHVAEVLAGTMGAGLGEETR